MSAAVVRAAIVPQCYRVPPTRGGTWPRLRRWLRGRPPTPGTWWAPRDGGVVVEVYAPRWTAGYVWFRQAPAFWSAGRPWIWQPGQVEPIRYFYARFDPWVGQVPGGAPADHAQGGKP